MNAGFLIDPPKGFAIFSRDGVAPCRAATSNLHNQDTPPMGLFRMDSGLRMDAGIRMDRGPVAGTFPMINIIRTWSKLGRAPRVKFFRKIADNLGKTPPPLANPNPPAAEYEAIVAAAEAAMQKIADLETALKSARLAAGPLVEAARVATETLARRCEDAFASDPAGAIRVGFEVSGQAASTPAGGYGAPQELATSMNENPGAIDWQCHPEAGADFYELETTVDPVHGPWLRQESSTRSRGTITGLPSGTRIYLRVRANGARGAGPWSEVSDRMVP